MLVIDRHGHKASATLSGEDSRYTITVAAGGSYVLSSCVAGHGLLAHSATNTDGDRPVNLGLSLPGETVFA
ncbi:hypothetical protein ACFVGX_25370 [Streptomyces sp. NPDC127113]|uniref:hypothetical protein n=1 Tax=Streptomyces sp. NPDC127113 TaxID=3345365 RepID=UPI003624DB4E